MIKTLTFTGEWGYLSERYEKPVKPNKLDYTRGYSRTRYEDDMAEYEAELKIYKKHKGGYKLPCSYDLIGKKIEFTDGINIIFGYNGSGKTTIIRALAGYAGIEGDGFPRYIEPLRYHDWWDKYDVEGYVKRVMLNSADIEWDGNPIYYHNFEYLKDNSCGVFGNLTGGMLANVSEEMEFHLIKGKLSAGQMCVYMQRKLERVASDKRTLAEHIKLNQVANDSWELADKKQTEYFSKFPNFKKECPVTLLLDEADKSLDVLSELVYFNDVLPYLHNKYNTQIIAVSHSPIVLGLSKKDYNIISINEDYTEKCLEQMRMIFSEK